MRFSARDFLEIKETSNLLANLQKFKPCFSKVFLSVKVIQSEHSQVSVVAGIIFHFLSFLLGFSPLRRSLPLINSIFRLLLIFPLDTDIKI